MKAKVIHILGNTLHCKNEDGKSFTVSQEEHPSLKEGDEFEGQESRADFRIEDLTAQQVMVHNPSLFEAIRKADPSGGLGVATKVSDGVLAKQLGQEVENTVTAEDKASVLESLKPGYSPASEATAADKKSVIGAMRS